MTEPSNHANPNQNALLTAVLAGAVYLIANVILGAMDISWYMGNRDWDFYMNATYTGLVVVMVISLVLFARGFIILSTLFENSLLKVASYLLIIVTVGKAIFDIGSLSAEDEEILWLLYVVIAVVMGSVAIVFGTSLIRLQDSMGKLSRVAGILEIVLGCLLCTVLFLFLSYVVFVPAVVVEILVLYRGYEYLSKSPEGTAAA